MLQFIFLLCTVHLSPQDKWITYRDSLERYTIQYPASWVKTNIQNAVGFVSPQENAASIFQENVNVMVQDLSAQPMTLKEYNELSKKQYTDGYGAGSVKSMKDTTFSGYPAEVSIFEISYGGQPIKLEQLWFIVKNNAYLLTYTAEPSKFDAYRHTAEKVIKSFKLL